jgi:cytochrome c556
MMALTEREVFMDSRMVRRFFLSVAVLSLLSMPVVLSGEEHHEHDAATGSSGHSGNPLKEEMAQLDSVFREVVSGVALGDGARVHRALEEMHGAMEKTHEGLHHGNVRVPKNADRVQEFLGQDKRFHAKLEKLAAAGQKNDQQAMLKLTKELLDACVKCHGMFRTP